MIGLGIRSFPTPLRAVGVHPLTLPKLPKQGRVQRPLRRLWAAWLVVDRLPRRVAEAHRAGELAVLRPRLRSRAGSAFNMLSSEMSIVGEWVVLQYWHTYFTENIGAVNGQDLQLDFGTGPDATWDVTLASSESGPVPGPGGIAAIAALGFTRRRRR